MVIMVMPARMQEVAILQLVVLALLLMEIMLLQEVIN